MKTSNHPVTSREYKVMLNSHRFKDRHEAAEEFLELIDFLITKERGTVIEKQKKEERRQTSYLDTPQLVLRQNGFSLRLREEADKFQVNLKYRDSDRYVSASKDLSASSEGKIKFEEDILPPFTSKFSHSNSIESAEKPQLEVMKKVISLFPGLRELGIDENTPVTTVNNFKALEVTRKLCKFQFEKTEILKASLSFWYLLSETHWPLVAEFSFDYEATKKAEGELESYSSSGRSIRSLPQCTKPGRVAGPYYHDKNSIRTRGVIEVQLFSQLNFAARSKHMSENEIFYPDAIKFHKGKKMRVRGAYAKGFPIGAIIHSTDGRPNDGAASTEFAYQENDFAYFVIGRGGKVFQSFSLTKWGEHAGPTLHPDLGNSLSRKLVGIEIVSAGKLKKISDTQFRPWYNDEAKKPQDDFAADEVRFRDKIGTPTQVGYQTAGHYHKFTEEQETALIKLLTWLKQQKPDIFKYENVLGHDEVGFKEGVYGRKTDPGACLSMPMVQFRERLINGG